MQAGAGGSNFVLSFQFYLLVNNCSRLSIPPDINGAERYSQLKNSNTSIFFRPFNVSILLFLLNVQLENLLPICKCQYQNLMFTIKLLILLKLTGYNKQYKTVARKLRYILKRLIRQPFHIANR